MVQSRRLPTLRATTGGRALKVCAAARMMGTAERARRGRMLRVSII
jgi:hypothetical protein